MEDYNFSKKYVSDNGIVSYEEIVLDNNIKKYQYLPYLDYIDENIVDNYNKFILKRRFGFYNDQNNPNIYISNEKRTINDFEIISNLEKQYEELIIFLQELTNNFNNALYKVDYFDRNIYYTYKSICETNLNAEISRMYNLIASFDVYKQDKVEKKKYNIKYLFIIMFSLYFIFLIFYNQFN